MTDDLRGFSKHSVSNELLVEQRRVHGSRAAVARALTGRRMRRRVVPPLAIGSMVVMGTAAAGIWVHGIVEPVKTGLASTQQAANPSAVIQQATLDQLRQQIAADEATLATLKAAKVSQAATAQSTQPGQPVRAAQQAGSPGKVAAGLAPAAKPTRAAAAAPKPAATTAAAPKPAPPKAAAPPPPPPAVHATSGASGGHG